MQKFKGFQKPKRLECELETLTSTYGKFFAEPLERGFGLTLGNSLRRVLLSSIEGAAVTSVRIAGVLHEFSTIPGAKEDVTDVILNLKQLRLKLASDQVKTLRGLCAFFEMVLNDGWIPFRWLFLPAAGNAGFRVPLTSQNHLKLGW